MDVKNNRISLHTFIRRNYLKRKFVISNFPNIKTSIEKLEDAIRLFKEGKSQRSIAEIFALSSSNVQHIIERFRRENRVENKSRSAPNKIFTDAEKRWIVRQIKENPHLSAPKLVIEVEKFLGKSANTGTIRRVLREANFHRRTA